MRKPAAIVLLFVFMLYHLGYYGIYLSGRYQLEKNWQEKLDKDQLSQQELLSVSIAITFPYRPEQPEFHPAAGMVEIEGKFYRIVKQRYVQDTLHIFYVKDKAMEGLHQSLQDWMASLWQQPASQPGQDHGWKVVSKDFLLISLASLLPVAAEQQGGYGQYCPGFEAIILSVPSPPPKV